MLATGERQQLRLRERAPALGDHRVQQRPAFASVQVVVERAGLIELELAARQEAEGTARIVVERAGGRRPGDRAEAGGATLEPAADGAQGRGVTQAPAGWLRARARRS